MKRLLVVAAVLMLASCAQFETDQCPMPGETITMAVGGSQVGTTVLAGASGIAHAAGFMAKAGPTPPPMTCHAKYSSLAIFGPDYMQISNQGQGAPTVIQCDAQGQCKMVQ